MTLDIQRAKPAVKKEPIEKMVFQSGTGNFFIHVERSDGYDQKRVRISTKDSDQYSTGYASVYPDGMRELAEALVMMADEMEDE